MILGYISDRDNIIKIKRKIGFCYCLQAITGLKDEKTFYFNKAISILKEIISTDLNLSDEEMSLIQYDLALVYVYYNNENYYEDLKEFVNKLENKLKEKTDLPCSKDEAYFLLGIFYENEFYKYFYTEDLKKTKECYSNALNLKTKVEEQDMLQRVLSLCYKEHAAYFYFRYAVSTVFPQNSDKMYPHMTDDLLKAVSIYNELLSTITSEEFPSIYFRAVKDLARCYMFLDEPQKAYDNLKKIIYMDDECLDILLYGSYIFAKLDLNKEDINILLKRYHRLVDYYNEKSDIENMCETKFELVICYYILLKKQNNKDYYDKGRKILDELINKYYGYFNTKRDGLIDEYNKLYEEVEKNSIID